MQSSSAGVLGMSHLWATCDYVAHGYRHNTRGREKKKRAAKKEASGVKKKKKKKAKRKEEKKTTACNL